MNNLDGDSSYHPRKERFLFLHTNSKLAPHARLTMLGIKGGHFCRSSLIITLKNSLSNTLIVSKMSENITIVGPDQLKDWLHDVARRPIPPFIPLKEVVDDMNSENPHYAWHCLSEGDYQEVWTVSISPMSTACC
jgi:hypothetical protein